MKRCCIMVGTAVILLSLFRALPTRGTAAREPNGPAWHAGANLEGFYPQDSLCGVTCAYITLRQAGCSIAYRQVLEQMRPGIYGSTMAQIADYLRANTGLQIISVRTTADSLYRRLRSKRCCSAIINLSDHWVVAQHARDGAVEILDFPRKYYLPLDALGNLWDGDAVFTWGKPRLGFGLSLGLAGSAVLAALCALRMVRRRRRLPAPLPS